MEQTCSGGRAEDAQVVRGAGRSLPGRRSEQTREVFQEDRAGGNSPAQGIYRIFCTTLILFWNLLDTNTSGTKDRDAGQVQGICLPAYPCLLAASSLAKGTVAAPFSFPHGQQ